MRHVFQIAATLLLAVVVLPSFAANAEDQKADAAKADPAKKDDKDAKADPAKKDAKGDAAKKDDKDAKADPAKKDEKKDAKGDPAKKDDKPNDAPKKDDKKSETKKDKKDEHVNTQKSVAAGTITGKILTIETTKRTLRLSVGFSVPVLDSGAVTAVAAYKQQAVQYTVQAQQASTQYNQAVAQAQQAASKKDKNGYQQNMAQAAQYQAQVTQYQALAAQQNALATRQQAALYHNVTKYHEVELSTTEELKVRNSNPPEAFDAKGKARRLTSKELKEARGSDTKLPGFQADFSNLREEQTITATLVKAKEQPKLKASSKKDKDADLLGDNLPQASLILIVSEPPPSK
jgi:hypothetical protein